MPVSWNRHAAAITTSASARLHAVRRDRGRLDAGRASSLDSLSAMLQTICTCTTEWSDMSRRSAFTCCMYHQARSRPSVLAASKLHEPVVAAARRADVDLGGPRRGG